MKAMFISDIHGIKTNLNIIEKRFKELKCDKLIILGDLYYIGPRNEMSEDYNIKEVLNFLNKYKDKIICIKGNCDSEVDEYVSEFPIIDKLGMILLDNHEVYITHGHIYNENNWDKENSILIYGHFHIPFIKENNTNIYINPGSISLPKDGNNPTFLIYDNNKFTIYDILGNIIAEKSINSLKNKETSVTI